MVILAVGFQVQTKPADGVIANYSATVPSLYKKHKTSIPQAFTLLVTVRLFMTMLVKIQAISLLLQMLFAMVSLVPNVCGHMNRKESVFKVQMVSIYGVFTWFQGLTLLKKRKPVVTTTVKRFNEIFKNQNMKNDNPKK